MLTTAGWWNIAYGINTVFATRAWHMGMTPMEPHISSCAKKKASDLCS